MKKLILLLTLTMMFGQTKLETRVYEVDINLSPNETIDLDLTNMTGIEINEAIVQILAISDISVNGDFSILYYDDDLSDVWGNPIGSEQLAEIYANGSQKQYPKDNFRYSSDSGAKIKVEVADLNCLLKLAITAEFPQEDTGYIEDGFDYCVEPGANLMSYPCDSSVALLDAIPSDALSQFSGIIGQGIAATQLPNGTWVGSLTAMQASSGYWIQSNTSLCFNYDCSEN